MRTLWLRAEGGVGVGLGHLVRSGAVGGAASGRGLDVRWVLSRDLAPLVGGHGWAVEGLGAGEVPDWAALARPGDVVVFDGCGIGTDECERTRSAGAMTVAVDDRPTVEMPVDLLVVPSRSEVAARSAGRVVTGPRFAPIRRSVSAHRRTEVPSAGPVLVTMGGGDDRGLLGPAVARVVATRDFDSVVVLAGPISGPQPTAFDPPVSVERDPADPGAVMAGSVAAVSAAGSTVWELLCIGVPTALVVTADNQLGVAGMVVGAGAGVGAGTADDFVERLPAALAVLADPRERRRLAAAGQAMVDGFGADRILDELTGLPGW